MYKTKWYYSTSLIAILFALWVFIFPPIIGFVLLILKWKDQKSQAMLLEEEGFFEAVDMAEKKRTLADEVKHLTDQKEELISKLGVLDQIQKLREETESLTDSTKTLGEKLGVLKKMDTLQQEINLLTQKKDALNKRLNVLDELANLEEQFQQAKNNRIEEERKEQEKREEIHRLNEQIIQKKEEIIQLDDEILLQSFGFYETRYDLENSQAYKMRLDKVRAKQKAMVKNKEATDHFDGWELNGSKAEGRKMNNDNIKMTLYSFNTDCDNAISKVKFNNVEGTLKRIEKSFEKLNRMNEKNRITIRPAYLELKKEELYLAYEYALKKEEEKEEQRRIREEMREEEKVRRELEAIKRKIEKEESHFQKEIRALTQRTETAEGAEKEALEAKIAELESKLALVQKDKDDVQKREQNTRAGYVYIISNIGSFGEHVYKIGLTRRLEPMDRVRELGDASVPFVFDVHAMIFSEDAPALENALHQHFKDRRVNKVNDRKEFFRVTLEEIEEVVKTHHNRVVEFTKLAQAEQYRQTLMIEKEEANIMHA